MSHREFIGTCSNCRKKKQKVRKCRGAQLCERCSEALNIYENMRAYRGKERRRG